MQTTDVFEKFESDRFQFITDLSEQEEKQFINDLDEKCARDKTYLNALASVVHPKNRYVTLFVHSVLAGKFKLASWLWSFDEIVENHECISPVIILVFSRRNPEILKVFIKNCGRRYLNSEYLCKIVLSQHIFDPTHEDGNWELLGEPRQEDVVECLRLLVENVNFDNGDYNDALCVLHYSKNNFVMSPNFPNDGKSAVERWPMVRDYVEKYQRALDLFKTITTSPSQNKEMFQATVYTSNTQPIILTAATYLDILPLISQYNDKNILSVVVTRVNGNINSS
jgi:hypothetical protein